MRTSLSPAALLAACLASGASFAADAPPACCTIHLDPNEVAIVTRALVQAPIPAEFSVPLRDKIASEANAEQKASNDYIAAHQSKPAKP